MGTHYKRRIISKNILQFPTAIRWCDDSRNFVHVVSYEQHFNRLILFQMQMCVLYTSILVFACLLSLAI